MSYNELGTNTFEYFWETAGKSIVFAFLIAVFLALLIIGGYYLFIR